MPKKRDMNAPYWVQLREAERRIIEYALEHGQTIRGTAAILGISSNYLSERARELEIPTPEVRPGPKPGTKRPQLRVVSSESDTTSDAPAPPKPPKPPRKPANGAVPAEDTLDEDDEGDEDEEWYEDPDEGDDEDEDDAEDAKDDEDEVDDHQDADSEDASQSGN